MATTLHDLRRSAHHVISEIGPATMAKANLKNLETSAERLTIGRCVEIALAESAGVDVITTIQIRRSA